MSIKSIFFRVADEYTKCSGFRQLPSLLLISVAAPTSRSLWSLIARSCALGRAAAERNKYGDCSRRYLIGQVGDSTAILCTKGQHSAKPQPHVVFAADPLLPGNGLATSPCDGDDSSRRGFETEDGAVVAVRAAPQTRPHAVVLTQDHSPARTDEAVRVVVAGGSISTTPGTPASSSHSRDLFVHPTFTCTPPSC